ncbi:MAG TPA: hypothetical protein VKQ70_13720 [Caulobacteraceae bacterium]|jgi:preprotein translocase subunit SecG|nr:hypothetical protein [Caulobacteraceae bacterium]
MTDSDTQAIRDDLAFLRGLVQRSDDFLKTLGRTYFAGGACYLVQTLLGLAQSRGWIPTTNGLLDLAIGIGPTAAFVIALVVLLPRGGRNAASGQADRAIGAFFGAIGLSNFALIAVIGAVALREKSFTIWLIYPCTVFIFQGAAWLTMFALRRQVWTGLVATIWFACAIGMGWNIGDMTLFAVFASLGLLAGMAAPGAWLMTRRSV